MNGRAHKKTGLTLIEMTLVVATIALLVGFGLPAVRSLIQSFESESGTRSMIGAALNSARTMAVKNQRYTGVRFQKKCTSKIEADPLDRVVDAPQYMIFIMHEERGKMDGLSIGYRAVPGLEPTKLPDTIGVIDLSQITADDGIDEAVELNDATAFSIIFSPAGKLVSQPVRVRNRDGKGRPDNGAGAAETALDEVFNSVRNITQHGQGMFIQDDYSARNPTGHQSPDYGRGKETSRTRFVIYDRQRLRSGFEQKMVWSEYLSLLPKEAEVYVSPYTGTLISSD